ncbi:MAG: transporter substrate-binding domain-containing protein ['Conium maculatum' witches'-broom phytoplasma]|nr:transporter substrate-binding domain-containing protein ['Conium maculatum' witches'-broom phytoplasma]
MEVETHNYNYDSITELVKNGDADCMMSATNRTPERDLIMSASLPYLSGKIGLVVRTDNPRYTDLPNYTEIKTLDRLVKNASGQYHAQPLKINSMSSYYSRITVHLLMNALKDQHPEVQDKIKEAVHSENCTSAVNTVIGGDSDMFAVDYEVAKYYANLKSDKVKTIKLNLDDKALENKLIIGPFSIFVNLGNHDLLEKLNRGIRKVLYRDYEGNSLYLPELEAKLKELKATSNPDQNKVNDLQNK